MVAAKTQKMVKMDWKNHWKKQAGSIEWNDKKQKQRGIRSQVPVTLNSPGAEHVAVGDPEYPPVVSHESEHALWVIVPLHPETTYPELEEIDAGNVHVAEQQSGEKSEIKSSWADAEKDKKPENTGKEMAKERVKILEICSE